jgi:hypothetical protein
MLIVSHDEIDLAEDESLNDEKVQEFLLALSLANTIYVEHNEEDILISTMYMIIFPYSLFP